MAPWWRAKTPLGGAIIPWSGANTWSDIPIIGPTFRVFEREMARDVQKWQSRARRKATTYLDGFEVNFIADVSQNPREMAREVIRFCDGAISSSENEKRPIG